MRIGEAARRLGMAAKTRIALDTDHKARVRGWSAGEVYDECVQEMALKRVTTPQDVANAVPFMASDDSRQITGQHIAVDGGWDV